ncbi:MAG TPA: helix-turn-helix domain-containing protein [Halococcus sp.]|nr:helix-turn-helix domain-containing protein [Halococcus sp.]
MAESVHSADAGHERKASASTTTGRLELPAAEFALTGVFERVPDARVELEPAVAIPDDHALLVVRTTERDHGAVENALRTAPTIGMVERFGERAEGRTYRVTWEGRARRLVGRLVAEDATLVSARARQGQWYFRLVTPDRSAFASAYDAIEDLGCTPECRSITTFEGERAGRSGLTDEQRDALVVAFEAGYYNVPRDATAKEVADILDISHQALSERFRRAQSHLVETEFIINDKQ